LQAYFWLFGQVREGLIVDHRHGLFQDKGSRLPAVLYVGLILHFLSQAQIRPQLDLGIRFFLGDLVLAISEDRTFNDLLLGIWLLLLLSGGIGHNFGRVFFLESEGAHQFGFGRSGWLFWRRVNFLLAVSLP
jgi:hypothetical protein